jgi:hypothetical protein
VNRDAIERRAFAAGRRDRAAVDEHPRRVAREMEGQRDRPSASGLLGRLDELEGEPGRLLEALRPSGARLDEGLARLHEQAGR